MPKVKVKSSEKTRDVIVNQTLVNLTEVLIYFDGMDKGQFLEMVRRSKPPFPEKVTRTKWALRAIQKWEEIAERVPWWTEDESDESDAEILQRYESRMAS